MQNQRNGIPIIKRKISIFFIGFAAGFFVAAAGISVYLIIHELRSESFVVSYNDAAAREAVEGFFGLPLPPDAGMLYFREEGFMDASYEVGVSLAPETAWALIAKYTGKIKTDFLPFEKDTDMPGTSEINPYWSTEGMVQPLYIELVEEEEKGRMKSHELIVYDEATKRLLVFLMLP